MSKAIEVRTPSGKKKRVMPPSHLTALQISTMTERTQMQMFGGVFRRDSNVSIRGRQM